MKEYNVAGSQAIGVGEALARSKTCNKNIRPSIKPPTFKRLISIVSCSSV